jgi:hypothetical protein
MRARYNKDETTKPKTETDRNPTLQCFIAQKAKFEDKEKYKSIKNAQTPVCCPRWTRLCEQQREKEKKSKRPSNPRVEPMP